MSKAVVIYSGGMDSFTLLHWAMSIHGRENIHALSFHYGQRHRKELGYAVREAERERIPHRVVELQGLRDLLAGSALTSDGVGVPEGHYAQENMKLTVVPNRNMIMLSVAIGYAVSLGAEDVYFGAHAGDHDIYPDCRLDFVAAMNQVSNIANYQPVRVQAPFIVFDKTRILKVGEQLGFTQDAYGRSWTCYNGGDKACGRCGSCVERLEAFDAMNWVDPLPYEDYSYHLKALAEKQQ